MNKISLILVLSGMLNVLNSFGNDKKPVVVSSDNEKVLILSPSPASDFINVNINRMLLSSDTANSSVEVRILNSNKVMVFSATKTINQFKIYVGGLPNGAYSMVLKLSNTEIKESFEVKH
jgi:hypothetical protein